MPRAIDLTGRKFRKLTAIRFTGTRNKYKQRLWECLCDCGKTTIVVGGSLTSGNTGSCGCEEGYIKHRGYNKGSYNTWRAMMRRCYNPNDKDYSKYGAVGVTVQDSWHDYLSFAADIGEPEGTQTLHRIDPYGDYTIDNCEWATPTKQARVTRINKRNTSGVTGVQITGNGKFMAKITVKTKAYYGKVRDTIEEAINDRKNLELQYW